MTARAMSCDMGHLDVLTEEVVCFGAWQGVTSASRIRCPVSGEVLKPAETPEDLCRRVLEAMVRSHCIRTITMLIVLSSSIREIVNALISLVSAFVIVF